MQPARGMLLNDKPSLLRSRNRKFAAWFSGLGKIAFGSVFFKPSVGQLYHLFLPTDASAKIIGPDRCQSALDMESCNPFFNRYRLVAMTPSRPYFVR